MLRRIWGHVQFLVTVLIFLVVIGALVAATKDPVELDHIHKCKACQARPNYYK